MLDIVVIGAGAAGITFIEKTLKLKPKTKICLIEAGNKKNNKNLGNFTEIKFYNDNLNPVNINRLFLFGGTTNHWGGYCRPLDPEDFKSRENVNRSGWPFEINELQQYEKEAESLLELNKSFYKLKKNVNEEVSLNLFDLEEIDFDYSNTKIFSKKYENLKPKINIYFDHIAYKLNINPDTHNIVSLEIINTKNNSTKKIYSKNFIISMGGIETTRFLLNNNNFYKNNYFNRSNKLGIGFNDHPHSVVGNFVAFQNMHNTNERSDIRFFKNNIFFQEEKKILNSSIRIIAFKEKSNTNFNLIKEFRNLFPKIASNILYTGNIVSVIEQEVRKENQITLSNKKDKFNIPFINFKFNLSNLDIRTIRSTAINFSKWFASINYGRIKLKNWVTNEAENPLSNDFEWYGHHMSTTIMGTNEENSVVDRNLKVHTINNLHVLSSSTFPTGGASNPTFTIVQLALRLAEQFKKII